MLPQGLCITIVSLGSALDTQHVAHQRFGHPNAVYASRENPARIASAFTGRVKAFGVQALQSRPAGNAQRRRGAGFDAGQHSVVQ